ncbi:hypothetical protein PEDI_46480 [Persicobacter diffluens]|uniref:Uncharacterized protein n=1 Tax=Persicobacter diffluens TaxID=981 RepID=A0AAN4W3N0_9BACT|nr:hypothetical protein PEDI_46480 [Persicobacter diffluens]
MYGCCMQRKYRQVQKYKFEIILVVASRYDHFYLHNLSNPFGSKSLFDRITFKK